MFAIFLSFTFLSAYSFVKSESYSLRLVSSVNAGFNLQVSYEYEAFYQYESMANHFSMPSIGLLGFAKFFQDSANEEVEHARKFTEFINKCGNKVTLQHIMLNQKEIPSTIDGVIAAVQMAIDVEEQVTKNIKNLYANVSATSNVHAQQFLDEFLEEQLNSVAKLTVMKSRLQLDPSSVFLLDQELRRKD